MSTSITERYRIKSPTIALFLEDGRQVAHILPENAVIAVESGTFIGNKLVEVSWDEKKVMMFAQDIRVRGHLIDSRR